MKSGNSLGTLRLLGYKLQKKIPENLKFDNFLISGQKLFFILNVKAENLTFIVVELLTLKFRRSCDSVI